MTSAEGSRPVRVTRFTTGDVFSTDWTPDSRRLVVSAGKHSVDAVRIRVSGEKARSKARVVRRRAA